MKTIVCYDAPDNRSTVYLRRKANGDYVLETEKLLRKIGRKWVECAQNGSLRGQRMRWSISRRQITEAEAIDWYVANVVPDPLRAVIRELLGEVVSVDLGVKLTKRLDRYCKAHGVSRQSVLNSAIMEDVMRPRKMSEIEATITHLQKLLARRFGSELKTASGSRTISSATFSSVMLRRLAARARALSVMNGRKASNARQS